jgi:hypothetical protein
MGRAISGSRPQPRRIVQAHPGVTRSPCSRLRAVSRAGQSLHSCPADHRTPMAKSMIVSRTMEFTFRSRFIGTLFSSLSAPNNTDRLLSRPHRQKREPSSGVENPTLPPVQQLYVRRFVKRGSLAGTVPRHGPHTASAALANLRQTQ